MGGDSVFTTTEGIIFSDGTIQTTAATSSGGAVAATSITNDNAGEFYLPLIGNSTALDQLLILDAPNGYLQIQADAGGGISQGGYVNLQSSNSPFGGTGYASIGTAVGGSIEFSSIGGFLQSAPGTNILITPGNSSIGVLLDGPTHTLSPVGGGHIVADILNGGVTLSATPPTAGQVLTATSATAADWQTPAGGSLNYRTVRSSVTSVLAGAVVGPIAMTFATPFADNNYTCEVSVVGQEVAPGTPTVTQFPSLGVSYIVLQSTTGAGVNVWLCNNDSITHTGIVQVTAIHD
jgi:hypothetical protein